MGLYAVGAPASALARAVPAFLAICVWVRTGQPIVQLLKCASYITTSGQHACKPVPDCLSRPTIEDYRQPTGGVDDVRITIGEPRSDPGGGFARLLAVQR